MIYNGAGKRKYLTTDERKRIIEIPTLAYTGARISEVPAIRAGSVETEADVIIIESLKKRRWGCLPPSTGPSALLGDLAREHSSENLEKSADYGRSAGRQLGKK